MKGCVDQVGLWWIAFMGVLGLGLRSSFVCGKHFIEWAAQLRSFPYLSVQC